MKHTRHQPITKTYLKNTKPKRCCFEYIRPVYLTVSPSIALHIPGHVIGPYTQAYFATLSSVAASRLGITKYLHPAFTWPEIIYTRVSKQWPRWPELTCLNITALLSRVDLTALRRNPSKVLCPWARGPRVGTTETNLPYPVNQRRSVLLAGASF